MGRGTSRIDGYPLLYSITHKADGSNGYLKSELAEEWGLKPEVPEIISAIDTLYFVDKELYNMGRVYEYHYKDWMYKI